LPTARVWHGGDRQQLGLKCRRERRTGVTELVLTCGELDQSVPGVALVDVARRGSKSAGMDLRRGGESSSWQQAAASLQQI